MKNLIFHQNVTYIFFPIIEQYNTTHIILFKCFIKFPIHRSWRICKNKFNDLKILIQDVIVSYGHGSITDGEHKVEIRITEFLENETYLENGDHIQVEGIINTHVSSTFSKILLINKKINYCIIICLLKHFNTTHFKLKTLIKNSHNI